MNLTDRQKQVLALLAEGHGYKVIAYKLEVGLGTVKTHLQGAYRRLGVNNGAQAIAVALEHGLIEKDAAPSEIPLEQQDALSVLQEARE